MTTALASRRCSGGLHASANPSLPAVLRVGPAFLLDL